MKTVDAMVASMDTCLWTLDSIPPPRLNILRMLRDMDESHQVEVPSPKHKEELFHGNFWEWTPQNAK